MAAATTVNIASEIAITGLLRGPIGVLQNKPYNGEPAMVVIFGLSKVFGGGTVTAGSYITYDSSGHVVDAVSGSTTIGISLETLTTAGEIGTAFLLPPVRASLTP